MKKILLVLLITTIAVSTLVLCRNIAFSAYISGLLKREYGLELRMTALEIGITKPTIQIIDLVLFNPKGFPDPIMLAMPEIFINYDIRSMFSGGIHLREMRLNLKECIVVKDSTGRLNINSLKLKKDERHPAKPASMRIDTLRLTIGRALYKDYTHPAGPSVKEFNINIDEEYRDVDSLYTLGRLIIARSLTNTLIPKLAGFDINDLNRTLSGAIKKSRQIFKKTEAAAKGVLRDTKATLGDVTSGIEGIFSETFGRKKTE